MKKTLLASSLAVGLGIVAGNAGHEALSLIHISEPTRHAQISY
ncbi:transglycosylase, partial [Staphylococcus aureus]|nr:transglycosylase [Staphylococcus aureus]